MDSQNMKRSQVYGLLIMAVGAMLLSASATANRSPASSPRNCRFIEIFNFGDSNSDTGGFSAAFYQYTPPYGQTFFHHPAGRATDGRLLIDFIAERFGLPYLNGYLDAIGSNFTHGVNFATAGSTIRPQNTTLTQSGLSPISLNFQVLEFAQFLTRSQQVRKQGGVFQHLLPEKKAFSRGLYNVDIGINDLLAGFKLNLTTDQFEAYVPDVLVQLSKEIKNLYGKGGRFFWIHNTGPFGCLPYTLVHYPVTAAEIDENGCSKPHNDVSRFFNLKLKDMVDELQAVFPLASFTYVDIYTVKYSLIRDAKKLGFDDPFLVCCGHGGIHNYDISLTSRCGVAKACKNPRSRINWDGLHYTEAANKWIFDRIVNDLC